MNSISIPEAVYDFFQSRNLYLKGISYDAVVGKSPTEVPREYFNDPSLVEKAEQYSFSNKSRKENALALSACRECIDKIFGIKGCKDIKRSYMINTSTWPVRVSFTKEKVPHEVYVKKPDSNRIVGKFLYEIVSGNYMNAYGFNEKIFLEEGIKGNPVSRIDEDMYLSSDEYKKNLVRCKVHADFLGVGDVRQKRNRLLWDKKTVLFDFDQMFYGKQNMLEGYFLQGEDLLEANLQEHKNIVKRVQANEDDFFGLVKIIGNLIDRTRKTIDERVKNNHGYRSVREYFEETLNDYSKV
ncbi:MAG: hypothetical protein ACQESF_05195 [Nanobdellota archaeon]